MSKQVQLQGVWKSYQDGDTRTEVLRGVDLEIADRETVAVVGPSGAGKSTLLHLMGALDRADAGSILVGGQNLDALSNQELARFRNRSLGLIFQFQELLPDFTALENVVLPARIAGERSGTATDRGRELLAEVGLADLGHRFPAQLSGGERQRVALCRALINRPSLILADEPTGSLDLEHGEEVMQVLLAAQREHTTAMVVVTHDPAIAARCGRVLTLRDGRLDRQ